MADRVRSITGKRLRDLTVSTFHAFGVKILRKEIGLLGYQDNFSIYDEADRNQLIKDCARELGFRMESFDAYKVGALFSQIRSEQRPGRRPTTRTAGSTTSTAAPCGFSTRSTSTT